MRARCQSVALLVHHVATKDYKHGPVWSAREASNHSVCPVTVRGFGNHITLEIGPGSSSLDTN